MNPKISVIVPVYKAEKYLYKCVDSILGQTFTDFEVLLVDDGSPDRSGEICDEYAARDSRVRVFHQENGGVTSARRLGVENALGEWINFVDSDDTLPVDALEKLYHSAVCNDVDIIVGNCYINLKTKDTLIPAKTYSKSCILGSDYPTAPWGKLIKRSLFTDSTLDLPRFIVRGEDGLMNLRLSFQNSKPVYLLNDKVYNYLIHSESCMHTFKPSLEYEAQYHQYRMKSIPKDRQNEFVDECVAARLNTVFHAILADPNVSLENSEFYKLLILDIKRRKYIPRTKIQWIARYRPLRFCLRIYKLISYKL